MDQSDTSEDTEDEGNHGAERQSHPEVGHPVVEGGDGHPVGEDALQADEEQPRRERHPGADVVERLGVIHLATERRETPSELGPNAGQRKRSEAPDAHLEVTDHDQTDGVGAARHQSAGVDPTLVTVLDHLSVAQEANHDH